MTLSQWDCLLKNLGCWQGSFTRISPDGEITEDIPSKTILVEKKLDEATAKKAITQTIRQFYPKGTQEKILEYSSLARSVLFFENGAFSQGATQLGFNSDFGAELGLIEGNSRRRLVQIFNKNGKFEQLTLIRETLVNEKLESETLTSENSDEAEPQESPKPSTEIFPKPSPTLSWQQLQGKWQCQAMTLYPDWRAPEEFSTTTEWLEQSRISEIGSDLNSNIKLLFLPNGVASICPNQVKFGEPLSLEILWMVAADSYQQMVRHYDDRGGWLSLTLATAKRVQ